MQTGDSYDTHMRIQFFMSMKKKFSFLAESFYFNVLSVTLFSVGVEIPPEATRSWACMNIQSCVICCQMEGWGGGTIGGVCIEQVWQA